MCFVLFESVLCYCYRILLQRHHPLSRVAALSRLLTFTSDIHTHYLLYVHRSRLHLLPVIDLPHNHPSSSIIHPLHFYQHPGRGEKFRVPKKNFRSVRRWFGRVVDGGDSYQWMPPA